MTTHGRLLARWCTAALLMLALFPRLAVGISLTLRDVPDPVPPGGTLTYLIKVNSEVNGGDGGSEVFCFNPPPECITFPATCSIGSVACVGNSFTGYVCENALNDGADCGVGDPWVPDLTLCVPRNTGICDGGVNTGFPCSGNAECPGETFVCVHASNEGSFCGAGYPPQPEPGYCLANPTGICSAGPNFGLPCTAPHGEPTDECPLGGEGSQTNDIVVTLPIPPQTAFLDADSGGSSDGEAITWTLPPLEPCGVPGTPQCPRLTARLMVDPLTAVGTIMENIASATDPYGSVESRTQRTTVGTFRLQRFVIAKAKRYRRDRFIYRLLFTLAPGAEIHPANELFRIQVDTPSGQQLLDLGLEVAQLLPFNSTVFRFVSREAGIRHVLLREIAPSHYGLRLKAHRLTIDQPEESEVITTLTLGDDVMTQPLSLLVRSGGRTFIGLSH